ncbi:40926_t:CDS:1, partial [Gigaspora margarita]
NSKPKDKITKLEQKQTQTITNEQEVSPTKDILPFIECYSYGRK